MKSIYLAALVIFITITSFAQNHFPYNIKIRDTANNEVSSKIIYNIDKPIIVEFWSTSCKPCIDLLNSYKSVYKDWQEKYGVKIVAISIDPKSRRKKVLKMIQENQWPFHFYLDYNKGLFKKMSKSNGIPRTIIYDGNFIMLGKFLGVKPNVGYKMVDGKITDEKIRTNPLGKYGYLDCDLTQYENVLELIKEQQ